MRVIVRLSGLAVIGMAMAGCSQITVTSNTLVNGTAQIADATTNAVGSTSDVTTNTTDDIDARTHAARVRFVHSRYAMIKREAARGDGQDLDALAYMMHASDKQAFEQQLQAHYGALFPSKKIDANQWLSQLYKVVGTPPDMRDQRTAKAG